MGFPTLLELLNPAVLPVPSPGATFLEVCVQASTPEEMTLKVQQALDEVIARNVLIVADPGLGAEFKLTIGDVELAGGGDGHTFVLTITFVPPGLNGVQTAVSTLLGSSVDLSPESFVFGFGLAGDGENLAPQYEQIVRQIIPESGLGLFNLAAGAAKGTRFMIGIGALIPSSPSLRVAKLKALRAGKTASKAKTQAK